MGGPVGGARSLIPLIRELVEKDDPILLHHLLEESVGLTNGDRSVHGARVRSRSWGQAAPPSPGARAVGSPSAASGSA